MRIHQWDTVWSLMLHSPSGLALSQWLDMSRQQMRWHKLAVLQRLAVPEYEPTLSTSRSVEDETIWARSLTSKWGSHRWSLSADGRTRNHVTCKSIGGSYCHSRPPPLPYQARHTFGEVCGRLFGAADLRMASMLDVPWWRMSIDYCSRCTRELRRDIHEIVANSNLLGFS